MSYVSPSSLFYHASTGMPEKIKVSATICKHIYVMSDEQSTSCSGIDA